MKNKELLNTIDMNKLFYFFNLLSFRMMIGCFSYFMVALFFITSVDIPNPIWPACWYVKPLIVLPINGLLCGLVTYIISKVIKGSNTLNFFSMLLQTLSFIVMLWLSIVLGFHGTLWN